MEKKQKKEEIAALTAERIKMKQNKIYIFLLPAIVMCLLLSSCASPSKKVPSGKRTVSIYPGAQVTGEGIYHSVAPGETLWRIAKMYGVDQNVLMEVNKISDVTNIEIGTKLYIPNAAPLKHVITLYRSNKWKYIIVHHSATDMGSAEIFNTAHKKKGWDGVGYHFIVDNQTAGKADGQIETTPRWTKQVDGAHCKASSMNERGIGICLVGNFSQDKPSNSQMTSLVHLVNVLRKYYGIPKNRILGHGMVAGAKTECPGTKFPWKDFMARLGR